MKLGILAVSTLIGVVSLVPAAVAQDGAEMHRAGIEAGAVHHSVSRVTPGPAPALQSVRPTSGMFTPQSGPARTWQGAASNEPMQSSDLRQSLRRE